MCNGAQQATLISTVGNVQEIPLEEAGTGGFAFSLRLEPGVYRFSILADAKEFDWDSLYYPLHLYGNKGQVTGPWDFDERDGNRALLPSYWVSRNGERIGLWYFARPSVPEVQNRRMRGRACFLIEEAGEYRFSLEPYRQFQIDLTHLLFERDPDDQMVALDLKGRGLLAANWAWTYRPEEPWAALRQGLKSTHKEYAAPLERALAWAVGDGKGSVAQVRVDTVGLIPVAAGFRLTGKPQLLKVALACIERQMSQRAWGNPREDGYGHEGDMSAGWDLRALALSFNWLYDHLGDLRERMLDAIREHGEKFLHNMLLQKDYWGGSVLQDHGWRANSAFGAAAFAMLGRLPQAEKWLAFVVQRIRQSVDAMPQDGVIPLTSWGRLELYMDSMTLLREGLLHATGEDLFDRPAFPHIIGFLERILDPASRRLFGTVIHNTGLPFIGGAMFLNRMAAKYRDGRAAAMSALSRKAFPDSMCWQGVQRTSIHLSAVLGLLSYDPGVPPAHLTGPKDGLVWYEDSGVLTYHDTASNLTFHTRCGTGLGSYTGYRRGTGPCDRISMGPMAGHFKVCIGSETMLVLPETGYRTGTSLGNCMLVAGHGQYGDIGYTMSIPQWTWRGQQIDVVRRDAESGTGWVRLNLGPAYPREAEVLSYTRDFLFFGGERRMLCRDSVALASPKRLTWLFHTLGFRPIELVGERSYEIRDGETVLRITADGVPSPAAGGVHETEIVWGYTTESRYAKDKVAFRHVKYVTEEAVTRAVVEFEFTW